MNTATKHRQSFEQEVIGISEHGEIITLESVFDHGSFRGATGSLFVPVSPEYAEQCNNAEYVKEYWESATGEEITEERAEELLDEELNYNCKDFFGQDDSYSNCHEKIKEQAGIDSEMFLECIGGGRCFSPDMKWKKVINPELLALALSYEK